MARAAKILLTAAHMDRLLTGQDIRIDIDEDVRIVIISMKKDAQLAGLAEVVAKLERLGTKIGKGAQTFVKELIDDMLVDKPKDRKKDTEDGSQLKNEGRRPCCRN